LRPQLGYPGSIYRLAGAPDALALGASHGYAGAHALDSAPNRDRSSCSGAIAVPNSHSAASPVFAIALAVGRRQRRICYKAEHTAAGTNLRLLVTNCTGPASQIFAFYNDRGECENRIEEFKNGFRADRLSCHRFLANAFRLLLHGFAYNLVNLFRLQLPQPRRSAQIETLGAQLFKIGARVRQTARCIRFHLATGWPFQSLFQSVTLALDTG
jgi:hypothetical protein